MVENKLFNLGNYVPEIPHMSQHGYQRPQGSGSVSTNEKAQIIQKRLSTGAAPCRLQAMCRSGLPFRRRITWMFPGGRGVFCSGFFVSRSAALIIWRNRVSISFRFASSIKYLHFFVAFSHEAVSGIDATAAAVKQRTGVVHRKNSFTAAIQLDDVWDNVSAAK